MGFSSARSFGITGVHGRDGRARVGAGGLQMSPQGGGSAGQGVGPAPPGQLAVSWGERGAPRLPEPGSVRSHKNHWQGSDSPLIPPGSRESVQPLLGPNPPPSTPKPYPASLPRGFFPSISHVFQICRVTPHKPRATEARREAQPPSTPRELLPPAPSQAVLHPPAA